jgi:tellurite resistance protein
VLRYSIEKLPAMTMMNPSEQRALLTIALLAAFADGRNDDGEREEIKRIAQSLAAEGGGSALADVYPDVLLKRVDVAKAALNLPDPGHRQLAYEMAVCVCDADGEQSPAEQAFLQSLRAALSLGAAETAAAQHHADALAAMPLGEVDMTPARQRQQPVRRALPSRWLRPAR